MAEMVTVMVGQIGKTLRERERQWVLVAVVARWREHQGSTGYDERELYFERRDSNATVAELRVLDAARDWECRQTPENLERLRSAAELARRGPELER